MTKLTIQDLLFNDQPITINRKLAKCLGLKEAVVFQQMHYWLEINKKTNNNYREGKYWTYNSIKKWHENEFDFLSLRTVERTIQSLEKIGLLESTCFNKMAGDKTKWYTINYDKLLEVCEKKLAEKEALSVKRSDSGKKGAAAKKVNNVSTLPPIQPTWQNDSPIQPTWQNDTTNLAEPIPEITTKISTSSSSKKNIKENKPTMENPLVNKIDLLKDFEENICELKKTTKPKFCKLVKENSADMVLAVIEECANTSVKSYKGFEVAFNSYIDRECKTREDVVQAATEYRVNKKTNRSYIKKTNNTNSIKKEPLKFNDFEPREYDYDKLEKKLLGWDNNLSNDPADYIVSDKKIDFIRNK